MAGAATPVGRTVLMLVGSASISAILKEVGISFDGISAANTPVLVELMKSSQATNGTNGAAATITQWRGPGNTAGQGLAPLLTAFAGYVAEPTVLTRLAQWFVSPTGGLVLPLPLGDEPELPPLAAFGLALRVTPPQSVDVQAYMRFSQGVS